MQGGSNREDVGTAFGRQREYVHLPGEHQEQSTDGSEDNTPRHLCRQCSPRH